MNNFEKNKPRVSEFFLAENERYRKELAAALHLMSEEINESLGYCLLADDASVSMQQYGFSEEDLKSDREYIKDKENIFITKEFSLEEGTEISMKMRNEFRNKQDQQISKLVEMLITVLFHKVLKKDYLMVRSSRFDDLRHGIDNVLINKQTGQVVCTLDDVHDTYGVFEKNKKSKTIEAAKYGGAKIKYGFTYEDGTLVKRQMKNIPTFFMSMSIDDFKEAFNIVDFKNLDNPSDAELLLFNKLLSCFEGQAQELRQYTNKKSFHTNIDNFEKLLPTLYQNV